MTNKYIAERREERARMMRIRKERQQLKAKRTAATVVAATLIAACFVCMCVIGFTVANNLLPAPHTFADAQVTKLSLTSADGNMEIATQAPQITASSAYADSAKALHFYGTGSTSEGYDWDYFTDNDIIKVSCDYDFETHSYDLIVTGKEAGVANITLWYYADDNTTLPISFTVSVDSDLNIIQI